MEYVNSVYQQIWKLSLNTIKEHDQRSMTSMIKHHKQTWLRSANGKLAWYEIVSTDTD